MQHQPCNNSNSSHDCEICITSISIWFMQHQPCNNSNSCHDCAICITSEAICFMQHQPCNNSNSCHDCEICITSVAICFMQHQSCNNSNSADTSVDIQNAVCKATVTYGSESHTTQSAYALFTARKQRITLCSCHCEAFRAHFEMRSSTSVHKKEKQTNNKTQWS